ncbi:HNH endonuclease signature motif containing protein [Arthrobacter sp. zg-Y750]|uniref:HNH endonuclease signature motif containing protein n=1 Tax=Arthrobacter sp. zg-Y750 TaxID=2894189 RepID=UPI001E5EA29E|nr:HNH endonuclease signature motif containing protein [Arthrobacter sp. zg-Y750]MCC9176723.1 HNH endonuclease [Arthrobacter sp. zg-Y750]
MDQLGNTERITEEAGSEHQSAKGQAGTKDASGAGCTLAVFQAGAGTVDGGSRSGDSAAGADAATAFPDGFSGVLALQNLESFDEQTTCDVLARVVHLVRWTQAQEARLIHHMEELFRSGLCKDLGREEAGLAFSLAASECAAILNVPQTTAQGMMFEADRLCGVHTATLAGLEDGRFSYGHAQVVLDQCENIPASELPGFESELLGKAEGVTRSQFCAKARRLRERKYPETVPERHLTAFDKRRVVLDRDEDGMSWLSAHLRAAEAQQIYTALSAAARGEQAAGDSRSTDQLRADVLAQLLMGSLGSAPSGARSGAGAEAGGRAAGGAGGRAGGRAAGGAGSGPADADPDASTVLPRAEIMVLINAETLFGANEEPAELHGYGPISAEEARRLARNAVGWTGLAQDPKTGEILGVGRRRKVPAGLARWLRARDGTCRFPGCRVSTAVTEIDHTTDWAAGGPTEHGNLEHLCRRHHRFKTLGYWKAHQPTPGVIEWTSPAGRTYRTDPFLETERPTADHPSAEPAPF